MSTLAETQRALKDALWEKNGRDSLDNARQWTAFVHQSPFRQQLRSLQRQQLALYESLLRNTVADTLTTFFPYCKQLLASQWDELVEGYRRTCPNQSFQLYLCAQDFPEYLANQAELVGQYPFIVELALYEWLEVDVENAPSQLFPESFTRSVPQTMNELAAYQPVWNTASDLRTWTYAIPAAIDRLSEAIHDNGGMHSLGNPDGGITPGETPVLLYIYRDPETHRARFFELNPLTAQLIALGVTETPASYHDLLRRLKSSSPQLTAVPLGQLLAEGLTLIQQCRQEQILLGSKPIYPNDAKTN